MRRQPKYFHNMCILNKQNKCNDFYFCRRVRPQRKLTLFQERGCAILIENGRHRVVMDANVGNTDTQDLIAVLAATKQ
jgi:hypothetical protein